MLVLGISGSVVVLICDCYMKRKYRYSSETIIIRFPYSTVTDFTDLTNSYFITFIYRHKSSDFVGRKVLDIQHQKLHDLIYKLKSEGLGYRKISQRLNEMGVKSFTGKEFYPSLVSNIYKGIEKKRKRKVYPTISEYYDFQIGYYKKN